MRKKCEKRKDGNNCCLEYDNVDFVGKLSFICLKVIKYMFYLMKSRIAEEVIFSLSMSYSIFQRKSKQQNLYLRTVMS